MTHVSNVQSFEKLLGICTGYGGSYNPGKQNLRVDNLSALLTQARAKILQVSIAKTTYEHAQNNREIAFAEMRELTSRILAELRSSGVLPQTVEDAAAMMRKIRGYVSYEKPAATEGSEANAPTPRKRNSADFGNTIAYFEKLLQTLSTEPMYEPINPELQLETLKEKLATLRASQAAVITSVAEWGTARRERNAFLYLGRTSLHSTAMAVKQQVKATFGYKSEETAAIRKVRFTKLYQ